MRFVFVENGCAFCKKDLKILKVKESFELMFYNMASFLQKDLKILKVKESFELIYGQQHA